MRPGIVVRMAGLLRSLRPGVLAAHRRASRFERRPVEPATLNRYDIACPAHRRAPSSGTVRGDIQGSVRGLCVFDLVCPAGHTYQYRRTPLVEMSAAELTARPYLACWFHDAVPAAGRSYRRDAEDLVFELTCPVGQHIYLVHTGPSRAVARK